MKDLMRHGNRTIVGSRRLERVHESMRVIAHILLSLALCLPFIADAEEADLVLLNGVIWTVDDDNPRAEAVAVSGDTIVYVGSDAGVNALIGDETRVVDLDGRLASATCMNATLRARGLPAATGPPTKPGRPAASRKPERASAATTCTAITSCPTGT